MVKVSVCLPVFRPGGLDITFASLRDQNFKDFELILVDRRYEKRHQEVMDVAKKYGVRTVHVPEHRRNGKWATVASAWNTAAMLAEGEILLMSPDYCYLPPDWIERHVSHHNGSRRMVLSRYVFFNLPPVVDKLGNEVEVPPAELASSLPPGVQDGVGDSYGEISIFREPFCFSMIENSVSWPDSLQCPRYTLTQNSDSLCDHVHFRNESMPLNYFLEMNGLDENMDKGKSHIDYEFGRRARAYGFEFVVDRENIAFILNPRTLFPTLPQGQKEPGRWSYQMCESYALDAGNRPAPNPYLLSKRREILSKWRNMDFIPTEELEIPDHLYYR